MIHYVGLSVQIHGLATKTAEEVRQRVEAAVRRAFYPWRLDSDLEVAIEEVAGTEAS